MGGHIQIGRLKLATSLFGALGLLLGLELLMLVALHQSRGLLSWGNVLWTVNLTAFIATLLGYLVGTFSVMTFFRTRPQMLKEEKMKLGIFD